MRHWQVVICLLAYTTVYSKHQDAMARSNDHLKPVRLFDLSFQRQTATKREKEHLHRCKECRHVLAAFTRQFQQTETPGDFREVRAPGAHRQAPRRI